MFVKYALAVVRNHFEFCGQFAVVVYMAPPSPQHQGFAWEKRGAPNMSNGTGTLAVIPSENW